MFLFRSMKLTGSLYNSTTTHAHSPTKAFRSPEHASPYPRPYNASRSKGGVPQATLAQCWGLTDLPPIRTLSAAQFLWGQGPPCIHQYFCRIEIAPRVSDNPILPVPFSDHEPLPDMACSPGNSGTPSQPPPPLPSCWQPSWPTP
jgi:hypothetical protein